MCWLESLTFVRQYSMYPYYYTNIFPFMLPGRGLSFCWGVLVFESLPYASLLLVWQVVQLSSQLHSVSLLSWNNLHVPQGTAQKTQWMEGWKKPGQPHKLYLLCTTQALSLVLSPFKMNQIIDFISLFDGWFLLMGGPVILEGIVFWGVYSHLFYCK